MRVGLVAPRRLLLTAALALALAALAGFFVPRHARAQPAKPAPAQGAVALLPLDAGPRLEIYGQAVATEVARALTAGGVEVVVVGANMDVPASARLIIDGKVSTEKGAVSLSMRVRDAADNAELDTLKADAPSLAQIDKAAAELSARVLPVVRAGLAAPPRGRPGGGPVRQLPVGGPRAPRALLVGIAGDGGAEPLREALAGAVERWARAARREPRVAPPRTLAGAGAPKEVAATNAERAIAFEIVDYVVRSTKEARDVPLARARVRVRISDAGSVLFDRVIATDTIVGERRMPPAELAARVADEVLAILRPHVRKAVSPWP